MTKWQGLLKKGGSTLKWPYPIRWGAENEVSTDVLVLGGGYAMAWRAGAESTLMGKSIQQGTLIHPSTTHGSGHPSNTWYATTIVDANGKEIPWVDRDRRILETVAGRYRPAPGQKFFIMGDGSSSLPHPGLYEYRGPSLKLQQIRLSGDLPP